MKRTVPGILLAVGWLLLLTQGSFLLFWAVMVLIVLIGGREYCTMAFPNSLYETDRIILPLVLSFPIFASVFGQSRVAVSGFGLLLGLGGLLAYTIYHYNRFENPLALFYRGLLGLVFVGFLGSHLVLLRGLTDGAHWLIILTAITAGSDTGAYLIGSRWGRRKLCPSISPNKTIEGGLGGLLGGVISAVALAQIFTVQCGSGTILVLAFILSIAGMLGDLLESIIKRGYRTKDSGALLGGHGGVLDRIDSLLLAGPLLFYILIYSGF